MMHSAGGALAMAVAALLVCYSAAQEQDVSSNAEERYDAVGRKTRSIDLQDIDYEVPPSRQFRYYSMVPFPMNRRFAFSRSYINPMSSRSDYMQDVPPFAMGYDRSYIDSIRSWPEFRMQDVDIPTTYRRTDPNTSKGPNTGNGQPPKEYPIDEIDLSGLPLNAQRP